MKSWWRALAVVAFFVPSLASAQSRTAGASGSAAAARPSSDSPRPLPWAGSSFTFDQSITPETLSACIDRLPTGQCTVYNPSYQHWFSLRPRWSLGNGMRLSARQDMFVEWTSSDSTTYLRQPEFGDFWLDFTYGPPAFAGFRATLGVRTQWPVSLASRALGRIVTVGAIAGISRAWSRIPFGNSFNLSVIAIASRQFNSSVSGGTAAPGETPRGFDCVDTSNNPARCYPTQNSRNAAFGVTGVLSVGYSPVRRVDIGLSMIMIWTLLVPQTPIVLNDRMGGRVEVGASPNDAGFRQATWFSASVDFEATPWLSFSAGYYAFQPVLSPSGTYYNPFWSPNNSRIFFTTTFALDEIYNAFRGGSRAGPSGGAGSRVVMNEGGRSGSAINEASRRAREASMSNMTF